MKNRLQYCYSITVFLGALVTAYLMMNNDLNARSPFRPATQTQLIMEAGVDPALNSLFEIEKGLGKIDENRLDKKRIPSQMVPRRKLFK